MIFDVQRGRLKVCDVVSAGLLQGELVMKITSRNLIQYYNMAEGRPFYVDDKNLSEHFESAGLVFSLCGLKNQAHKNLWFQQVPTFQDLYISSLKSFLTRSLCMTQDISIKFVFQDSIYFSPPGDLSRLCTIRSLLF